MALNLVQGNVHAGNIHSSDAFGPIREGEPMAAFVPDKDRASVQLMWVVSKDTKKKEIAEAAIDLFCGEEFQEIYALDGGSPTGIPSVAAKVAAKDKLWALINPHTPEHFKNLGYYPYDAYFRAWDHIVEVWDREVLRKKS
jgi:ABC-type glycerol-3-phosphate transport system substrate-binding protein